MDAPHEPALHSVPSATGTIARLACARLRSAGLQPEPLLRKAGLRVEQIDRDDGSLEVRSQIRFLQIAAEALEDNLLGFHLARDFNLRDIGLLYYVLNSSSSFADALANAKRYTGIVNDGTISATGWISRRSSRSTMSALNAHPTGTRSNT